MKPNILFILLDGFRADKFYGDKKTSFTPNINSLIQNGTYFSQTISCAPSTIPSVSSIMTSLYPFECIIKDENVFILNPKIQTHINKLKKYGYNTYATYQDVISFLGLNRIFTNVETYSVSSKLWNGLGEKIIDKLESKRMKEPWMYYLHLYDLHTMAETIEQRLQDGPKEINNEKLGVNHYERIISAMDVWIGKILQKIDMKNTLIVLTSDHGLESGEHDLELEKFNDINIHKRTYDPGLIYKISHSIMTHFPKFLLPLRKNLAKKYTDRSMKIVNTRMIPELKKINNQNLTPHRKRLFEHCISRTINVYDERIRVPLFFGGCTIPSNKVITQQVGSIDIFPTIFEIVGIQQQKNLGHGISLFPLMLDKKLEESPVFLEAAVNAPKFITNNIVGLRTSEFKYFRDKSKPDSKVHLYDLRNDPLEEYNVADEYSREVENMENSLIKLQSDNGFNYEKSEQIMDDEEERKIEMELRKLGYV